MFENAIYDSSYNFPFYYKSIWGFVCDFRHGMRELDSNLQFKYR